MVHDLLCSLGRKKGLYTKKKHAKSCQIPPSHWPAPYIQSAHKNMYIYMQSTCPGVSYCLNPTFQPSNTSFFSRFSHGIFTYFWGLCWYFWVFVDTFGVLLTETSRIFHGSFAFSTAAQRLRKLTMFVACKWKKSLNIWSKSRKQHVDLKRPMFSKLAVFLLLNTVFLMNL